MRKHPILTRTVGVLTAAALCAVCTLPVLAAPQADPDKAVIDNADILSKETEAYVTNVSTALQNTCGAQIGVYTVDTIGNYTMEGYTYELANDWGLGDADKDNGIVLLLAPGEDNYHAMCGSGLETQFTVQMLQTILNEDMEPNWVNKDYDAGTQQTVYAMAEKLSTIYGLTFDLDEAAAGNIPAASTSNGGSYAQTAPQEDRGGVSFTGILVLIVVLAVVVALLATPRRRYYGGGYRGPTFIWFGGPRGPRPPRPPRPPYGPRGPRGPRGPGGFGGGSFRGGGAGRMGGGGSFRAGGGSFRGGGAGRR